MMNSVVRISGVPYGIRTRVASVKGTCPRPLDEGDPSCVKRFIAISFGEIKSCFKLILFSRFKDISGITYVEFH